MLARLTATKLMLLAPSVHGFIKGSAKPIDGVVPQPKDFASTPDANEVPTWRPLPLMSSPRIP